MGSIAVVGGSGFIGSRLCRRLERAKADFIIIDKEKSTLFPNHVKLADVRSLDALRNAVPEGATIINLAAEHRDDVRPISLYDEVNVQGAENICSVAREKHVKIIVFTSSVAVYGFAPLGTDEDGEISPFNDYGRTKHAAEQIFKAWQEEDPKCRTLVIVRPTVVFGEQNRGNVYNLLRQIAGGRFLMVGNGRNRKSMAYVENVAAFLEAGLSFLPGIHVYNYIDKPDFTMNELVGKVYKMMGKPEKIGIRLPYAFAYAVAKGCDVIAAVSGRRFSVSSIRIKKFCSNSVYNTAIGNTGFLPPVVLSEALERTVRHEFLESHVDQTVFYSE